MEGNNYGAYFYSSASISREEVIETKIGVFAEFINTMLSFCYECEDSVYLDSAITFIFYIYNELLLELNREHTLYDKIMCYLAELGYPDELINDVLINNFEFIFDYLDSATVYRLTYYQEFCHHEENLLSYGILTRSNFVFPEFQGLLTEEKSNILLSLIPQVKETDISKLI